MQKYSVYKKKRRRKKNYLEQIINKMHIAKTNILI